MEPRKRSDMILKNFHRDYFKRFFLQENGNNFITVKGVEDDGHR